MPSKSDKQHRFMEMIAHNPEKAKQLGVPQKVGKDFVAADKASGKHFKGKTKKMSHGGPIRPAGLPRNRKGK